MIKHDSLLVLSYIRYSCLNVLLFYMCSDSDKQPTKNTEFGL